MADRLTISSEYWNHPAVDLIHQLRSSSNGLTAAEAALRLQETGPNTLKPRRRATAFGLFFNQFRNPLVLILIFAASVSAYVQEWVDSAVILAIVLGSAIVTFSREYSATTAIEKLRSQLTHKITALRDGLSQTLPAEEIVPGDVVLLSAGSLAPGDGVILEARDCFVNQGVLTGETFPVGKEPGISASSAGIAERTNCVLMGTSLQSGTARVLIVRTATTTEFGQIAKSLVLSAPETEFERGVRRFGYLLTRIMVVLVFIVFTVNVLTAKPRVDSLLFAIALAVGLSPELLPAIITITLARGARAMASQGVIVRRLTAIENFGSMDVLCTDKTGTLTEGLVLLDQASDIGGAPSEMVFRYAYLNSYFQTGLSNTLDEAVTAARRLDLSDVVKLDEIPYDFTRKRLSVVVREGSDPPMLITKGAFDNVLAVCSRVQDGDEIRQLDAVERRRIEEQFVGWSTLGMRVLGVAIRLEANSAPSGRTYSRADECDLTFIGFLRFFDPPKQDVKETIASLARLGVRLKIITGDNRHVARHVAEMVGIQVDGMVTGADLSTMRDEALWHLVGQSDLFAEVDPGQKERIIRALQQTGHVVGYLGDGINDAPALHNADVGISVNGAVDVAREAADLVLLDRELGVLHRGVILGRETFANSLKYIFTTTSANFGNMFSMAGASLFLPYLPLLPKQILLNNFLSDFPALTIAGDRVDEEWIERPHRWDIGFIRDFMIVFGLISSLFDFATFGVLLYLVRAAPEQFQTGWFVESLLTELAVALIVRTKLPSYLSRPGKWLTISTAIIAALTLILPYLPETQLLGLVPLPLNVMGLLLLITLLYVLTTEAAKQIFFARRTIR